MRARWMIHFPCYAAIPATMLLLAACASAPAPPPADLLAPASHAYTVPYLLTLPPEVAEQPSKTILNQVVEANVFTIDRGLKEYENFLGERFIRDLHHLTQDQHWIDGGSGDAYAQKDYLGSRDGHRLLAGRPKMTAITLKYPADQPLTLDGGRFKVMAGRYFEDIPLTELEAADLITDVTGVINYTHQLDLVLTRYLELLKPGGKIYVVIPPQITVIRTRGGIRLSLQDWLRRIPGLSIRTLAPKHSTLPSDHSFSIQKVASGIRVPRLKLSAAAHDVAVYRVFLEE